jgi:hypothetical protein
MVFAPVFCFVSMRQSCINCGTAQNAHELCHQAARNAL